MTQTNLALARASLVAVLVGALAGGCALAHSAEEPPQAPAFASSASLVIDDDALYYTDRHRHAVMRASRGGGPAVPIAAAEPSLYAPIAVTATEVVWGDVGPDGVRVMRAPLEGGAAVEVGLAYGGPIGLAADAEHIYYTRLLGPVDLVEVDLRTDTERVVTSGVSALGILVDGDDLLVSACSPAGLTRVARSDGAQRPISSAFCAIELARDGDALFFTDYAEPEHPELGGSGIFRAPIDGGAALRVTRSDGIAFAVHDGTLFTAYEGWLVAVDDDGTERSLVEVGEVRGVAVDDARVYFTEDSDSSLALRSVPRPY